MSVRCAVCVVLASVCICSTMTYDNALLKYTMPSTMTYDNALLTNMMPSLILTLYSSHTQYTPPLHNTPTHNTPPRKQQKQQQKHPPHTIPPHTPTPQNLPQTHSHCHKAFHGALVYVHTPPPSLQGMPPSWSVLCC